MPGQITLVGLVLNPFNASIQFQFATPAKGKLEMEIFGVDGRLVKVIRQASDGDKLQVNWEPKMMASGVYFFRAALGGHTVTSKCLLLK